MKNIYLDTPELTISRAKDGAFEILLKASHEYKRASDMETHHFARVLAAMTRLDMLNAGTAFISAVEDFVAATVSSGNYFIKRMYFSTQPEMIARWYSQPAVAHAA